jgi:hypothetical protein
MSLTISIDTSSSKAKAFVAFIKTLDFIKINDDKAIYPLSDEQKEAINKAIKSAEDGEIVPHEKVMKQFENHYPKYFSK